jgi:outer membrane lipoprotein-sorting protein
MRRLRTTSTRRLYAIAAAVAVIAAGGGIAQAALGGSEPRPDPKPLDRAVLDAVNAPAVDGVSARIEFTNGLLPGGSLPEGGSPLAAGAEGRLWLAADGALRLELQSDSGDAQITSDGERVTIYDSTSNTVYRMDTPAEKAQPEPADEPATLADVRRGLERLAEAWTLSGAEPGSTGGRPSYTVRIAPKDDGGLLGAAELAWDAARGVPLRAAVYAQGQDAPVLELAATDVSYGAIPAADLEASPPADARVVEIDPPAGAHGEPVRVRGVDAVQQRLGFELAAPDELAGLPRKSVRLVQVDGSPGALSIYGEGMGAILVFQHEAPAKQAEAGTGGLELPQINIDGATGTELATPLGTLVSFDRGGVSYIVAGSVPPVAAENAARGLR